MFWVAHVQFTGAMMQDRIVELVKPFRDTKAIWQVRIEASRALLDLEFHSSGIDAALSLFMKYVVEEPSLRGFLGWCFSRLLLCTLWMVS